MALSFPAKYGKSPLSYFLKVETISPNLSYSRGNNDSNDSNYSAGNNSSYTGQAQLYKKSAGNYAFQNGRKRFDYTKIGNKNSSLDYFIERAYQKNIKQRNEMRRVIEKRVYKNKDFGNKYAELPDLEQEDICRF